MEGMMNFRRASGKWGGYSRAWVLESQNVMSLFRRCETGTSRFGNLSPVSLQCYLTFHPDVQEVINVSPGYRLTRNRKQNSVTLGDEMFVRKKPESEIMDKVKISR